LKKVLKKEQNGKIRRKGRKAINGYD